MKVNSADKLAGVIVKNATDYSNAMRLIEGYLEQRVTNEVLNGPKCYNPVFLAYSEVREVISLVRKGMELDKSGPVV